MPMANLRMTQSFTCNAAPEKKVMPSWSVPRRSMVRPRSETTALAPAWTMMAALLAPVLMTASTPSATMLIGLVMVSGPKLPEVRTLLAPYDADGGCCAGGQETH